MVSVEQQPSEIMLKFLVRKYVHMWPNPALKTPCRNSSTPMLLHSAFMLLSAGSHPPIS